MPASPCNKKILCRAVGWLQGMAILLVAATSAWGAIASDVAVSTNRSGPGSTVTSPAFSTAAVNELLLAFIATDANSPGMTVKSVTGAGLTWVLVRRTNMQLGTAEIWRAFAPTRLANVTVQANLAQSVAASITVVSFTGIDTSGTNGSGAIGATGSGNANPGAPSATLVTTRENSWVLGVGNDYDKAVARTVPDGQTLVNQYLTTDGGTYWVQRRSAPTPAGGTTVTINDTSPATDRYNLTIVEVLAASGSAGSRTVTGAIVPASLGSGTTVTLGQDGTTVSTTTADGNGNYSFAGFAGGTYTVTPVKTGNSFTPVTQSVTITGGDATVAPFAATSSGATIATDITVSASRSTYSSSVTTPAFSTASANELLLAFVATDANTPGMTTSVTGAGLTWDLVRRTNAQPGTAEIWRAFAPDRLTNVSVRADLAQSVAASLTVISFTGVDTSGTNGSGAVGATAGASDNAGAPTASLMTTRDNSWVYGVGNDYDTAIARTVPAGQTMVNQYLANAGATFWVQRRNAFTPAGGSTVTINDTAPTTAPYNLTIVEVRSAGVSGGTIFGAITPSLLGSGSALILSQSGTTVSTATADGNGNYSFTGTADGTYTVTPVKAGIVFSPTSQSVTVNGGNATVPTFAATSAGTVATVSGAITPASLGSGATVTLGLGGATVSTITADGNGSYSFTGIVNGAYSVTPTKPATMFSPTSQSARVNGSNITVPAFTATASGRAFTVSGTITPAALGSGATVTLSQGGATLSTATADGRGNYSFTGRTNGTYTVTPVKAGIGFDPASRVVTVSGGNATVPAFAATTTVSGTISPASSGTGTLIVLSGQNLTSSKTADSSGSYSFTGLEPGTYIVTPSKAGAAFTPASRTVTISGGSVTANFTASAPATNLTVDGAQRFQTMDGMGVNINVNSWNNGRLKPALDFLIAINGSTLFRVVRDPMDWVASESLIPALHALDPTVLQQVYETARMQDIWNTIGYLNQKGIRGRQIILNFMGWTPAWLGGSGAYGVASHITQGKESEFATMAASLLYYGKTVKGLDFSYLSPFNEEDWNCLEGPCLTATQYTNILRAIADELSFMGVAGVRFVGPETANIATGGTYITQMLADSVVAGLTDHFALHDYSGGPVSPGATSPGKNYWVTETSAPCSSCDAGTAGPPNEWSFATQTADLTLGDIKNGFAAVLLWDGYDSFWYHHNASDLWGFLAYKPATGLYTARKRAYACAQFNRFIAPGDVVIGSGESIASVPAVVAVHNPTTGKVAIMGRNSGAAPATISGQLANLPAVAALTLYQTNPSANLARTGEVSVSGEFFTAEISADSIFTLTNQPITPLTP